MSPSTGLRLVHGQFFGSARRSYSTQSVEVAHRLAEGPPGSVGEHTHEDLHFIVVTGGHYVSAAGQLPGASRPVLLYNPPGITHRDHFEGGRGSFFSISMSSSRSAPLLSNWLLPTEPQYLHSKGQFMLARAIAAFCTQPVADLALENLCVELVGTLTAREVERSEHPPRWLLAAIELLQDRYSEGLSIADVAQAIGVHPVHLARAFRRHLGCTPAAFSRSRRLEKAVGLLAHSALSLTEVALESGFADQSQLSKAFWRGLGVTPGQYRALAGQARGARCRLQNDKTCAMRKAQSLRWLTSSRRSTRPPT